MLTSERMRARARTSISSAYVVIALAIGACAEPEPGFAPPGALRGRNLPGVQPDTPAGGSGVFGAPYDAKAFLPTTTVKDAHGPKNQPLAPGDCFTCHNKKPTALGPPFAYGGRVVLGREGTAPAPNVDVIVIQGDVKLGPVKSDADGYFWLESEVDVTDGRTTIRSAESEAQMIGKLFPGYGSCSVSGCHGQTPGQPQVYVEK